MNENFYWLLRQSFLRDPSRIAMEVPGGRQIRYGELDTQAGVYSEKLRTLGVEPGDRVLVQVEKSPEAVFLYLACLRSGAVFVPINTAYTPEEVAYFRRDAEPALFVCRPADEGAFARVADAVTVRSLGTDGRGSLPQTTASAATDTAQRSTTDLAAILYTSGTTGRSKGAMLSHGNLATNAVILIDFWGWHDDDVLLHALPVFHVHGLFIALHCALLKASKMIFLSGFDVAEVLSSLPRSTVMMGVPTF
ncbi:MAG: AMP-binding protein, partial [Pseudomonadales bacterium]|nr:AMP-binding protein [Pseudomonadales bacterium]